jgi:hypothetical protein
MIMVGDEIEKGVNQLNGVLTGLRSSGGSVARLAAHDHL